MVITDHYDHVIDDKNRLAIPSQIRNTMDPVRDGAGFYLVPRKGYLQLIPEKVFERNVAVKTAGIMPAADVANVRRAVFSNSPKLEPDKQGRVIIPERFIDASDEKSTDKTESTAKTAKAAQPPTLTQHTRLKREVTLVGNGDRLELWNRNEFIEHMAAAYADPEKFERAVELMFGDAPAPEV